MNIRNFKCFQIVYEERNLQVAAGKLFLSPQGLSKIIKNLEDECGVPLFNRTKEGFIPTKFGKIFYEKSKEINRNLNELIANIESLRDKEKRFKIGFAAGSVRTIDIPKMKYFMESNPEIFASWHECDNEMIIKQVLNEEIGCGFVIGRPDANNLKAKLIKSVNIVAYVYSGHKFWDRNEIDLKDIAGERLVVMNERHYIYQDILNACSLNGFAPDIVARVAEGESIKNLVKNKIGIGIAPRFFEDDDKIKAINIKDAQSWDVYAIYRHDSIDKDLAKKLISCIL